MICLCINAWDLEPEADSELNHITKPWWHFNYRDLTHDMEILSQKSGEYITAQAINEKLNTTLNAKSYNVVCRLNQTRVRYILLGLDSNMSKQEQPVELAAAVAG